MISIIQGQKHKNYQNTKQMSGKNTYIFYHFGWLSSLEGILVLGALNSTQFILFHKKLHFVTYYSFLKFSDWIKTVFKQQISKHLGPSPINITLLEGISQPFITTGKGTKKLQCTGSKFLVITVSIKALLKPLISFPYTKALVNRKNDKHFKANSNSIQTD